MTSLGQSIYVGPNGVPLSGIQKLSESRSLAEFGGVCNGYADDYAAFQRAFQSLGGLQQHLNLPGGSCMTSRPLVIPNKMQIWGNGRGDLGINTIIKALPNFPASGTVVQMGPAPGPDFGIQVHNLTIDGSAIAGVCLSNQYAQEQSYGRDLLLQNCGTAGLQIMGGAAQNSGPFEDLEIYPGSGATVNSKTLCVQIQNVIAFRGINGLTCNAGTGYGSRPAVALQLDGGSLYENVHVEHFATAFSLGDRVTSADSMTIINGQFGPDVDTAIAINDRMGNQNINIMGQSCFGCKSLLEDSITGRTVTDVSLGFYFLGNGTPGPGMPVLTSASAFRANTSH